MQFKSQYVWPSRSAFPFRHYYSGKNLDIFFIENIFHNFEWLDAYKKRISDRHFFFSITGWHIDKWSAKHSSQMLEFLNLKKENFFILANDETEKKNLKDFGFNCDVINHNAWLDEDLIKPAKRQKEFNAIMIARKTPFKRHHLANKVEKLALISGGHNAGNPLEQPLPNCIFQSKKHLFEREVCEKISQSFCGLCLSALEGACYSSSEYLLCGTPVVSTQSLGGRDYWYDSYNSLICDDNEESVAAAVEFFVKTPRNPEKIRNDHIAKQKKLRSEFVSILNSVFLKYDEKVDAEQYFLDNFEHKMRKSYHPDFESLFPATGSSCSKDSYSDLFEKFKDKAEIFIESGTCKGASVSRALDLNYRKIISIEPHKESYLFSVDKFKNNAEVELINDFSENVFEKIINEKNEKCLVFLDGHKSSWFPEGTQPLEKELRILSNAPFKDHTIIIDDYHHMPAKDLIASLLFNINKNYNLEFYPERNGILVAHIKEQQPSPATKYIQIETNRGAGIAHQTHEYFSLFAFCKKHNLELVYCPFTLNRSKWNVVLGFENLHLFKKDNLFFSDIKNVDLNEESDPYDLILNYQEKDKVLFKGDIQKNLKLSKFPKLDLIKTYEFHKQKFGSLYEKNNPFFQPNNIVVHIRRGDVSKEKHPDRFLDLDYFKFVLEHVTKNHPDYSIHLLSQGNVESDLSIFDEFKPNIKSNITDVDTFYHMVNCDVLVGSKSGFSHLCHVLGKNKCYRPHDTWGAYYSNTIKCDFNNKRFV